MATKATKAPRAAARQVGQAVKCANCAMGPQPSTPTRKRRDSFFMSVTESGIPLPQGFAQRLPFGALGERPGRKEHPISLVRRAYGLD